MTAREMRIGWMMERDDSTKAVTELGLPQAPTDVTITKAPT